MRIALFGQRATATDRCWAVDFRYVWALLAATALCAVLPELAHGAKPERLFRAGAYAMDITPEKFPVSSNGSMTDRQATHAHDPLHARCLVLDDGERKLALVVIDACMIPREICEAAKSQASETTGIPTSHMLISATHTHSGVTLAPVFQSPAEVAYGEFLAERIAAGIVEAAKRLEPAQIGWGAGRDETQVFNRRWFMKSGTANRDPFGAETDRVRMNPGVGSPTLDRPAGPTDPEVSILSVQSQEGKPIALLANYSLHYVGGVEGDALSADYFAEFAREIGRLVGGDESFVGIMSNGTSGNINNINFSAASLPARHPYEQMRLVAASVAQAAFKAYGEIEYRDWVPLAVRETEVELGVRKPSEEELRRATKILDEAGPGPYQTLDQIYANETVHLAEYPDTVRAKLQAIRIGELGIVTSPCETFVETGLAIKKHSPLEPTFTIELANGYNGYLPTPEHHEFGGYETWRARSSYLAIDAEPKIRRTLLELLEAVAEGK